MQSSRRFSAVIFLLALALPAAASNQHEHFYSYFLTDAFFEAYRKVFGKPIGGLTIGEVSSRNGVSHSPEMIEKIFGKEALAYLALKPAANPTLDELSTSLAAFFHADAGAIQRQFFEFGPQNRRDTDTYMENEHVRRRILVGLFEKDRVKYQELLTALAESTMKRTELVNRKVVAFSVPFELFDRSSLESLAGTFAAQGSATEFSLSYPRYRFDEPGKDFDEKLALLARSLKEGWAHGVDITGSIEEEAAAPNAKLAALYESRMMRVARIVGEANGVFKVHAFEATDKGPFYDALWKVLDGISKLPEAHRPRRVVMGHIGSLSHDDINRLTAFNEKAGLPIAFDANLLSNELVQGMKLESLAALLRHLHKAGFEIGLGGDGQGIIGEHDLARIQKALRGAVPTGEFPSLWASLVRGSQLARAGGPVPPCSQGLRAL